MVLQPKDAVILVNRGITYVSKGENERALEDFNQAISIDAGLGIAYANRALILAYDGMEEEARDDAERAIALGMDRTVMEETLELNLLHQ